MGDVLASSSHLLAIINDLLDLAKIESGKTELRPQEVDSEKLVEEVRDILRGLAAEKREGPGLIGDAWVRQNVLSKLLAK